MQLSFNTDFENILGESSLQQNYLRKYDAVLEIHLFN